MKKIYYLLASISMLLVIVVACEQASIEMEELQAIQEIEISAKGDKVDICHWDAEYQVWVPISIATEAVQKHMDNHGDKYSGSPEGSYVFHYELNGVNYPHTFVFTNFDGINFEGTGYWPENDPYTYEYEMVGTVDEFGNFEVHTVDHHPTWTITGTFSNCDDFDLNSPWSTSPWY